ncbi:Anthocyanidin 3-O-glucosyltransferase 5-like protein [Drosera capensis]
MRPTRALGGIGCADFWQRGWAALAWADLGRLERLVAHGSGLGGRICALLSLTSQPICPRLGSWLRLPLAATSADISSPGSSRQLSPHRLGQIGSGPSEFGIVLVRGVHGRCIKAPILASGPLVSETGRSDLRSEVMEWLDKQPAESVLLISFGTGGTLMTRQTIEMAWGLEMSQQRFVWVIRQPLDYDASPSQYFESKASDEHLVARYLPQGFLDRTKEKGKVVPLWAPCKDSCPLWVELDIGEPGKRGTHDRMAFIS